MKIHHIAYMVADSHQATQAFSVFAPVKLVERQPLPAQGAFISMLGSATDGTRIELVEPFESNVSMRRRIEMSGGDPTPYHICYSTTDFDLVLRTALADGWLMVTKPFQGLDAGMRATHLYKRSAGMVEIIEDPEP